MHRYLTPTEVFGAVPQDDQSLEWLRDADQEVVLGQVAFWMSKFDHVGLNGWKEIERNWVSESINEPFRSRLLELLQGDRVLVSPQSLLIVAKRALTAGHPSSLVDPRPLFMAAVSIQWGLGGRRDPNEDRASRHVRLLVEVLRAQMFHRRPDWTTRIAQSEIRWREIPALEGMNLPVAPAESFERVTGVPLVDFQSIGFYLFAEATAHPGGTPTVATIAEVTHWDRDRLERALALISAPIADIAAAIRVEESAGGENWTFDPLRRFPILRLDGDRILVLSPGLLMERTFGWLPYFDMTRPDNPTPATKVIAKQAEQPFQKVCEREVIETLRVNVAVGRRHGRFFDGAALRAAYPTGQIADAAIAYRDEWLIFEVSSGQLKRETVVGGVAALDADFERLVDEKVDQIDATIAHIRADPARLTGDTQRRRRFVPVLVIAEGMPLNPLTHITIADRLTAAGRLRGADVEVLHILEMEDLYVAETIVESERLGLNEVLDLHRHAGLMRRVDLRAWWLMERRLRELRPNRLNVRYDSAMDLITENLGMDKEVVEAEGTASIHNG